MDPEPWITTDDAPEAMALRAAVFVGLMLASLVLALGFRDLLGRWRRGAGPLARRALGRPAPPPWEHREWLCGGCRSLNAASAARCRTCRTPRATGELRLERPAPGAEDQIPARIEAAPPSTVVLEHRAAAHGDGLVGHWRLRVNGVVSGTAAHHGGALALLRALDGPQVVVFDPDGGGHRPFPLAALIAAFEGPRPPIPGPCPELAGRR